MSTKLGKVADAVLSTSRSDWPKEMNGSSPSNGKLLENNNLSSSLLSSWDGRTRRNEVLSATSRFSQNDSSPATPSQASSVDANASSIFPGITDHSTISEQSRYFLDPQSAERPFEASIAPPDSITSTPTLHPNSSRDNHDSSRINDNTSGNYNHNERLAASEGLSPVATSFYSSSTQAASSPWTLHAQQQHHQGLNVIEPFLRAPEAPATEEPAATWRWQTMGYTTNNNNSHTNQQQAGLWSDNMTTSYDHSKRESSLLHHSRSKDQDDDNTTIRSTDSVTVESPAMSPLHGQHILGDPSQHYPVAGLPAGLTTPSTVSTAASTTDEGSAMMDPHILERLALRMEHGEGSYQHRRVPSWDAPPRLSHPFSTEPQQQHHHHDSSLASPQQQQHTQLPNPWHTSALQQRVASFREQEDTSTRYGYASVLSQSDSRWQQQQQQRLQETPSSKGHYVPQSRGGVTSVTAGSLDARLYRPGQPPVGYGAAAYHHASMGSRPHPPLPPVTPPRTIRNPRLPGPSPHRTLPGAASSSGGVGVGTAATVGSSNVRSSSEVLKTLLRKKACLYEPDTSRAVALVTWLVGRELALQQGFFSRHQLQAGVHACVAEKIDSGVITRTKVNRCMQIILNSCFHYIIPRPDGTEENGDVFRVHFAGEAADDASLLRVLPHPWNDLTIDHDVILAASMVEQPEVATSKARSSNSSSKPPTPTSSAPSTPQSSPHLGSIGTPSEKGSPKDDGDSEKRAVLLCFNENVRCAQDVFRCHNEFIRDTAHASHLQLSSQEWLLFFGSDAASAPYLWGNIGIPIPYSESFTASSADALGMMANLELACFRTTWCSKRYDHDHDLCGFAHVEVNGGWLRRNLSLHNYDDTMCPSVMRLAGDQRIGVGNILLINECPHGVSCEHAHSPEEIVYHPRRYKRKTCVSVSRSSPGGCHLGDACPDFHSPDHYRFPSKKTEGRAGGRHAKIGGSKGAAHQIPPGSPILYGHPAPLSCYEEHLLLPGLQSLFRRHCSVVRAHLRSSAPNADCACCYSYFGDDTRVGIDPATLRPSDVKRGLPSPRES